MIVADKNLIVYLFVTGDQTTLAQKVLDKDPYWIVPPLWQSEFRNVIASYMRRGRGLQEGKRIMQHARLTLENRQVVASDDEISILIESSNCTAYDCEGLQALAGKGPRFGVRAFARTPNLGIYPGNSQRADCEFVALARQLTVYLVTADKQLLKEFPDCAISLEDFIK